MYRFRQPSSTHGAPPRVLVVDDADVGAVAALPFVRAIAADSRAVIGVATGSTPTPVYESLGSARLDLRGVTAFALDEYVGIAAEHPESYREVIRREVTDPLGLDPVWVHVPDGSAAEPDAAAAHYDAEIRNAGGIDVQLLGIGENGHIGFNEPGSAFDSRTRVVELDASTRAANARFFPSITDVPERAMTQGIGTILEARQLVLVARGEAKARAVRDALLGPISRACPASAVQLHPCVTIVLDRAAASLLD